MLMNNMQPNKTYNEGKCKCRKLYAAFIGKVILLKKHHQ